MATSKSSNGAKMEQQYEGPMSDRKLRSGTVLGFWF